MTRLLHIADLHLDRAFAGMRPNAARERRRELFAAFERCLDVARERAVDAITIGGDLWEDEHVTADTRRAVARRLGELGLPVLLIAGNHDPLLPGGHHERTEWQGNVHLFGDSEPRERRLDGVSVWGVSWTGGDLTADFLDRFSVPQDGRIHVLLLHGTPSWPGSGEGEESYCPFEPEQVSDSGFALALCGHLHGARHAPPLVYPGSPEPLDWGETGRHCAALVELESGEPPRVELMDVNRRTYEERPVDCADAGSRAEIAGRVAESLDADREPAGLCLRLRLTGEVDPECEVRPAEIATEHRERYAELVVIDATHPGYDLEALAREHTTRGLFVRRLRERIEAAADESDRVRAERALLAGLRALDGRSEVLNVD